MQVFWGEGILLSNEDSTESKNPVCRKKEVPFWKHVRTAAIKKFSELVEVFFK